MRMNRPQLSFSDDMACLRRHEEIQSTKIYICAILDLYDRRIVAYIISEHNGNLLVFQTFEKALTMVQWKVSEAF